MKIRVAAFLYIAIFAFITPAFAQEPADHHDRVALAPVVVDSTGKIVGPFARDLAGNDEVFLPTNDTNNTIIFMPLETIGIDTHLESLVYKDTDCSGTPYMAIPNSARSPFSNPGYFVVPQGFYAFFDNVLYYPATGATPQEINSGSTREVGSTTCNPEPLLNVLYAPVLTLDLSRLVPPFRVVLR